MTNLTKELIKETFLSLLNQKPLTQITVKMVVEECGINRNSFYYHYQDLPALIEEMVREETDRIINSYPIIDSAEPTVLAIVDFASKNKKAILNIYNSVNRDIFEQYLWKVCDYIVDSYGQTLLIGKVINDSDKEILARFFRCECFGFIIEWLDRKMKNDVQKDISRFCELYRGMIDEMIARCIKE